MSNPDSFEFEPFVEYEDPSEDVLAQLHAAFEFIHIDDLNKYQEDIGLMRFIREPFPSVFAEYYAQQLELLTDTQVTYIEELEERMYEDDELLNELAAARRRHERRRDNDGTWVEPEHVAIAFWTRRNVLAYLKSLELDVEDAFYDFPARESSQEAG